jgi:hypothetical protein
MAILTRSQPNVKAWEEPTHLPFSCNFLFFSHDCDNLFASSISIMKLLALLGQQPKEYSIAWMNIIGQAKYLL